MRCTLIAFFWVLCAACAMAEGGLPNSGEIESPQLSHVVFFDLKNDDETSVQALLDGCYKYLAPHDGIVYFSAGPRHQQYQRDVNDLEFDVALTIVFENTAAQDAYQITEPHKQFIAELEDNWERVRVFDSQIIPRGE